MNITITGVFEALNLVTQKPNHYRVISIASKKSVTRLMIEDMKHAKDLLILEFDDASANESSEYDVASPQQCKQALDFLSKGGDCIIHCHAGVSRSTGLALGYLLTLFDHHRAVDRLFELRPCAQPNKHVIKIMCDLLHKQELYPLIIDYISQK
ncbi:dual specificity protein phosphatase family protein [Candidatus Uabimicrobium amorphum]|uniref:Phosphatase n=1 Tax=Uabimicrobium amorphum TaxID=2596890 RepID=A0A5S9F2P1_UABAM|nr:dual specificity protein phosphatase family protein [Candidatus Uabimicrobium amorphum]BBM83648.1 phosphatase [Candidatus Uabimicrobium amorphum]